MYFLLFLFCFVLFYCFVYFLLKSSPPSKQFQKRKIAIGTEIKGSTDLVGARERGTRSCKLCSKAKEFVSIF